MLIAATGLWIQNARAENYSSAASTLDAAGTRTTSASYSSDGSLGGMTGVSTSAVPSRTLKQGYVAQLFEVSTLSIGAAQSTLPETDTTQLQASLVLDDASTMSIAASALSWSIVSGPIDSISSSGLVLAGSTYANSSATVSGSFLGKTASVGLTVLEGIADNFGLYAGDALDDAWQVQYFGPGNVNARPGTDFDGDGFSNLSEFAAGTAPTSSSSFFTISARHLGGSAQITFSPRLTDRSYTVQYSTDLSTWQALTGHSISDNGSERTITDPSASAPQRLYRVLLTKP